MATNAKIASAGLTTKRGRPKSGDPFRDEEVEAIAAMQTQRRWTTDDFHQRLDSVYRISRDHFNKILQRKEGGRRGVDPRIRTAFAKVFDWPEARSADFPLGCIQEFLSKLPVSPEHFVGRTDELAFLSEAWNGKKVQVVALIAQPRRALHRRVVPQHHLRIPKGFRPKAQGCEERATLGKPNETITTPTGLWLRICEAQGVQIMIPRSPGCAALSLCRHSISAFTGTFK